MGLGVGGGVECAISKLLLNEIWFALGMCLCVVGTEKIRKRFLGMIGIGVFLALSIVVFYIDKLNGWFSFGLGLFVCIYCSIGDRVYRRQ